MKCTRITHSEQRVFKV